MSGNHYRRHQTHSNTSLVNLTDSSPPSSVPQLNFVTPLSSSQAADRAKNQPQIMSKPVHSFKKDTTIPTINSTEKSTVEFGSSIVKPSRLKTSTINQSTAVTNYSTYIKPATVGAFRQNLDYTGNFSSPTAAGYRDGWPAWAAESTPGKPKTHFGSQSIAKSHHLTDDIEETSEEFDLNAVKVTAEDYARYDGDADEHMRELLAGAVGDGEDDMGDDGIKDGEDQVEGFADSIKLMPHQVRGVRWMREREKGRKYGGILADDMGLGKTVQALARIVEGRPTAAEKKVYKGGTLIVAPLAVMEQWATECRTKTRPGLLRVTTHHGPSRAKTGTALESFDVVITTFQILSSEFNALTKAAAVKANVDSDASSDDGLGGKPKRKTKAPTHALFDVKWLRVVIDEAQNIKNHKTQMAKAAVELKSKYRWCLTGTPIQNNVEELYSLFKFLRARPLDNWQVFKARVSSEVKEGRTGVAMKRLHVILKAIMLRRTKDATIDGKPILRLPLRNIEVIECPFDSDERAFYDALEQKTALSFNKFLNNGTAMSNYTSVLSMLLRLRQACDHPSMVAKALATDRDALVNESVNTSADADEEADELAALLSGMGVATERKCEICFIILEDQSTLQCIDCQELARKAKLSSGKNMPHSSAKIRMLLKIIRDIDERSRCKEKTIVFSQFTSFLDIIQPFFRQAGIAHVRYDGSMRADQRQSVLEAIKTSPTVRVILISFKAGSTGLNLTCCNNVILMDLWWNPALEDQAFDRAHRLGQKLDVNIFKLTVADTVEDRILMLQNNKRELAKAALSGQGIKNMKLTLNDMMQLFQRGSGRDDA